MKQQLKVLEYAYISIGVTLHETFHAIMAFILNVKMDEYNVEINFEKRIWKGNICIEDTSPIKKILICSAPPLFTIILMFINLIFDNYFIYCFIWSYFLCGILRCSNGDWENIKDSFRKIKRGLKFRKIKFLRKYKIFKKI